MRRVGFSSTLDDSGPAQETALDLDQVAQVAVTSEPGLPFRIGIPSARGNRQALRKRQAGASHGETAMELQPPRSTAEVEDYKAGLDGV